MLQLLRLLLYLAAGAVVFVPGAQSTYFESAPSCGYAASGFVHFEQSPELLNEQERSLGVCGWGFTNEYELRPRVKSCVACSFTPADQPSCSKGATLVSSPVWYLAPKQECQWLGCWLGAEACSNGTVESSGLCDNGARSVNCCRFKPYKRCCSAVPCTYRTSPAGRCVVGEKDLLPGQQSIGRLFAVSAASTDCHQYSFETARACQPDRTFMPEVAYESCEMRAVSRDSEGCVKLPGYTFHQGMQIAYSDNWRIDDGTQWGRLVDAAAAQQAAARDMLLMAARCSALETCAGFQNTGASTDLLYQVPTSNFWVSVAQTADTRCYGIYEKTPPPTSCPRISGYLFIMQRTLNTAAASSFTAVAGDGPCSTCANSSALAAQCDSDAGCTGFSNYHGLLARANANNASAGISLNALLSDAPMTQFTTTPCAGMFVRSGSVFPSEVEKLDRLLCGERIYCTSTQLRYHATTATSAFGNYYVDITVDILTDLTVPRGLADASGGGLRPLPSVRSLTFRCRDGSALLGGLPAGLAALTPFLQELRVSGCRVTGLLPPALAQLPYLRVLDISRNALSGSLPKQWGNMTLGYLNLSSNSLTGPLPTAWRAILKPRVAAAVPPPPPVAAAPLPPPLAAPPPPSPLAVAAGRRRRVAHATAAAAAGLESDMLVADFSGNKLEGPVDRAYVYDSCVRRELRMHLRGEPSADLVGGLGLPTFLLQSNPGIAAWAGGYVVADSGAGSGSSNLCGAVGYKIALGLLWGVFAGCLLTMAALSAWLAWRAARAARRGRFFITDVGGPSPAPDAAAAAADVADSPAAACRAGCASLASRVADVTAALWRRRWVRRVTLLLRIGYLAADVALDVRVAVWLFADGDSVSAAVCLAFLVVAQAAVSVALLGSLAHHFFASNLQVAVLSPLLLALGPVAGPVLAIANIRNSDVPLVFWRYLELVEFCVALLQAPAESVTQSVVYARHNRLGNGMYLDHALFLASIILSLGDMTIAALKLLRYKRGPFRRLLVAVTHLDRQRDPVDYQKPLLGPSLDGSSLGGDGDGDSGYTPHFLDTPLNPPAAAGTARRSPGAGSSQVQIREGAGPLPMSPPGAGGAAGEAGGETAGSPVLELSPREQRDVVAEELPEVAVATAHTFTPLTAPRYRPSLLAASSQRLGGGSAHAMGAPSRLGPGGSSSRRGSGLSAHPPLRPSMANLPATPKATQAAGGFGSGGNPDAASAAQVTTWTAAEADAARGLGAYGSGGGAATGDGSLGRRSRSLHAALPAEPIAAAHPLAGSISSEMCGSAATGGHGPSAAQEMARSALSGSGAGPFHLRAAEPLRPSGVAAASELPPPSPPADPRLFSAAAALQAALGGTIGGGTLAVSRGPGSGAAATTRPPAPPERLILGPAAASSAASSGPVSASEQAAAASSGGVSPMPSVRALRHVSSATASSSGRSVPGSPARRREVPALSIAVPASPVQSQGIQVIRVLTPGSSRNLSPQTSRGAPTPVGMLPPPPPQHLQHILQQERRGRQQHQQQEQQREQGQQGQDDPGESGALPAEAG